MKKLVILGMLLLPMTIFAQTMKGVPGKETEAFVGAQSYEYAVVELVVQGTKKMYNMSKLNDNVDERYKEPINKVYSKYVAFVEMGSLGYEFILKETDEGVVTYMFMKTIQLSSTDEIMRAKKGK